MAPTATEDLDNPIAVGFNTASAKNPPYPAQQHLDVTGKPVGGGFVAEGPSADEVDNGGGDDEAPGYDATVAKIEEWVVRHPEDAQEYLDAENAKENPRSSLVEALEKVVAEQ